MEFNVNDEVTVTLTEHGASQLRRFYERLDAPLPSGALEGASWAGALWQAMAIFGPHLHNGGESSFQNNRIDIQVAATKPGRHVVEPTFCVGDVAGEDLDLVDPCRAAVTQLRFDATALPVHGLYFEARPDGVGLAVDIRVPDRDKPGVDWIHVWRSLLCPWRVLRTNGPDYLVRWTRETIANVLAHEVDESVTLQGQRVFDPHRPLLAEDSQAPTARSRSRGRLGRRRTSTTIAGSAAPRSAPMKPTRDVVRPWVKALYAAHCAGCCLHVVLDDGNIDDASVRFCVQWAKDRGHPACEELARAMLRMSKTQRGSKW